MLRRIREIKGLRLRAINGVIGRIEELYFHDKQWTVKYLVANTAAWLPGWEVLIWPLAVRRIPDATGRAVEVRLTKAQVESSPVVDEDPPVSKQLELQYHCYPDWPSEWNRPPSSRPEPLSILGYRRGARPASSTVFDPHLQSTREVTGYHVEAQDGKAGRVEDFVFDDLKWTIRYLVVAMQRLWGAYWILIPPAWVAAISWSRSTVEVNLERHILERAPKFDKRTPIDSDYETQVQQYYQTHAPQEWALAA